jgi:DnaJ family protein B protein 4
MLNVLGFWVELTLCRKMTVLNEILTIDVKPGWKKGTKITFPRKGNEQPGVTAAADDLVFVIDERPHGKFKRDGNDLVVVHKIPLADALTGCTISLTTLDGRSLSIAMPDIIPPRYEKSCLRKVCPLPKSLAREATSGSSLTSNSQHD